MRLQMDAKSKNFSKTRWIALVAGTLLMSTLGIGYIWSLLVGPMIELRGATESGMASIYTGLTVAGAILTIVGGKCVDKFGSSKVILSSIILSLAGELLCAFSDGVAGFAVAWISLLAWGQAVVYIAVYTNIIKMFPDWKGLAVAISATGIAIGGVYLPIMTQYFIGKIGFDMQFVAVGIILAVVGVVSIIFFPDVKEDVNEFEEGETEENGSAGDGRFVQKDWKMMLKDPAFYLIFLAPLLGTTTYMLLTFQLAWIAQDILPITEMQSAFLVSGISIIGVISGIVGPIGDKAGRLNVTVLIYAVGTIAVAGLIFSNSHGVIWFTVCAFLFAFCFGGFATIHPVIVSDLFGSKNYGFNYSICYQSVLIASGISPWLGVLGGTDSGDYTKTFTVCTIMCAVGLVLMIVLWKIRRHNLEPQPERKASEK